MGTGPEKNSGDLPRGQASLPNTIHGPAVALEVVAVSGWLVWPKH